MQRGTTSRFSFKRVVCNTMTVKQVVGFLNRFCIKFIAFIFRNIHVDTRFPARKIVDQVCHEKNVNITTGFFLLYGLSRIQTEMKFYKATLFYLGEKSAPYFFGYEAIQQYN